MTRTFFALGAPAVHQAFSAGGYFNVIHLYYLIKTDFYIPVEPMLRRMIDERIYLPFDAIRRAAYISPTAVIMAKLLAYNDSQSTRHLEDIASIVRLQGSKLDGERIDITAARLGLMGVWRAIWEDNHPSTSGRRLG